MAQCHEFEFWSRHSRSWLLWSCCWGGGYLLNGISIPGRHLIILSVPLRHGRGRGWLVDIWIGETSQARNRTGWSSLKPAAPFSCVHSVWNRELFLACALPWMRIRCQSCRHFVPCSSQRVISWILQSWYLYIVLELGHVVMQCLPLKFNSTGYLVLLNDELAGMCHKVIIAY